MSMESEELISLHSLAELTGFPIEMLKEELLSNGRDSFLKNETISMNNLRTIMFHYLDSTMMASKED